MSEFTDMMNNEECEEYEYDDWEEYVSEEDIDTAERAFALPPSVRKETEEEKEARVLKYLADITVISKRLNWVGEKNLKKERELDSNEFPVLGTKAPAKDKTFKIPKFSSVTTMHKLVISGKSYSEKFREKQSEEEKKDSKRTEAFSMLADKEFLEKKLEKTRMCNSIDKKENCPHGDKCRFAHSLAELNISKCFFGNECRFIKSLNGKVSNCGSKVCPHQHPNETIDEFYRRTNLDRFKPFEPKILDLGTILEKEKEFKNDRLEGINWARKVKESVVVDNKSETVLRVPRELASQAIELAMRSGNSTIRVEVV